MEELLKSELIKELNEIDISYGIIKDELCELLLKILDFENIKCVSIKQHYIKDNCLNELKDVYISFL